MRLEQNTLENILRKWKLSITMLRRMDFFFDPKIENVIRIYYNIRKIINGQRNDYTIIFISKNTMR